MEDVQGLERKHAVNVMVQAQIKFHIIVHMETDQISHIIIVLNMEIV